MDGRVWVWKQKGEKNLIDREISETLKFKGGSLMMWGCMLWEGTGVGYKIDGKMDKVLYTQILEDELQGSLEHYCLEVDEVIF